MSNSFILPQSVDAEGLSRDTYNETMRSAISIAYGNGVPTSFNFRDEESTVNPYQGFLYRNPAYNGLFIYDPAKAKGGGLGGGFTRSGIGFRLFEDLANLTANLSFIETAELVGTVGNSANYRFYLKSTNSNGISDIGIPSSASITTGMFANRQVTNVKLTVNTVTRYEIAPYTIIGNKLANNLNYTSNLNVSGNIVSGSSTFGITFPDGTRQITAIAARGQNVTTNPFAVKANLYGGMLGANLRFKAISAYTADNASLYTGQYRLLVTDDNSSNTIFLVLQRGTATVPVGDGGGGFPVGEDGGSGDGGGDGSGSAAP